MVRWWSPLWPVLFVSKIWEISTRKLISGLRTYLLNLLNSLPNYFSPNTLTAWAGLIHDILRVKVAASRRADQRMPVLDAIWRQSGAIPSRVYPEWKVLRYFRGRILGSLQNEFFWMSRLSPERGANHSQKGFPELDQAAFPAMSSLDTVWEWHCSGICLDTRPKLVWGDS